MKTNAPQAAARWPFPVAIAAALLCVLAIAVFAAQLDGYRHASHPLGWLGGRGLPGASAFNLLAFVLPGAMLAAIAWQLRDRLPAGVGWASRIGTWLLLLSALAFAAQGLLPLDLEELDAGLSRGHAVAWMLWLLAFVLGAWVFGIGSKRRWLAALGGLVLPFTALILPVLIAPGLAQRMALALWFGCWVLLARALSRGAVSSAKSSSPAQR